MSESNQNLSIADVRIGIVVSQYHRVVTDRLLEGARQRLHEAGVLTDHVTVATVPGAWEIPLATQWLAHRGQLDAIICLGAVIRGETTHDQYINHQVSQQIGALALQCSMPIAFGVLTCQSLELALQRAGGGVGNKGIEAADAVLHMLQLRRQMDTPATIALHKHSEGH